MASLECAWNGPLPLLGRRTRSKALGVHPMHTVVGCISPGLPDLMFIFMRRSQTDVHDFMGHLVHFKNL